MNDHHTPAALAAQVLHWAAPGEQLEVYACRELNTTVSAREGRVEEVVVDDVLGVGIRVVDDHRQGCASSNSPDPAALRLALDAARHNAAAADRDTCIVLAVAEHDPAPVVDTYRESLASLGTAKKIALALALEQATTRRDSRVVGVMASQWSDSIAEDAVMSTTGVNAVRRSTWWNAVVHALSEDGTARRLGTGHRSGRGAEEVDLDAVAEEAVARSTRLLGAQVPGSATLPALLTPQVTAALLSFAGRCMTGDAVSRGRSPFMDQLGSRIAPAAVTLVDDPLEPSARGAGATDAEGVPSRRTVVVDEGRLQDLLHDTISARRTGTRSSGSAVRTPETLPAAAPRALALAPGPRSVEQVLAEVTDGILIQSLSGLPQVDVAGGAFSLGATGFRIRGGARAEPLAEMAIALTLRSFLSSITEVCSDRRWFDSVAGATVALDQLSVRGT